MSSPIEIRGPGGNTLLINREGEPPYVDKIYGFTAGVVRLGHVGLRRTQTGQIRWYATGIAAGAVIVLGIAVFR